jgi:hypothetical protein
MIVCEDYPSLSCVIVPKVVMGTFSDALAPPLPPKTFIIYSSLLCVLNQKANDFTFRVKENI